jgi:EAL domain-containing protein (putative c-di-GMP-specific phosphodiesterase class I)
MILSLARTLGLYVVAEGVETVEQLRRLDELCCALGQGFHLGRPAAAEDVWVTPAPLLTA